MSFNYGKQFNNPTQEQVIPDKAERMIKNNDGCYVFQLDKWQRLNRFLIIGCAEGTYYSNSKTLTIENAQCAIDCIKEDGVRVVNELVEISDTARAPKNDAAIFVLALCCAYGNQETKNMAYKSLNKVCRIGTHLFNFMSAIKGMRGSSRGLRNAIKNYYESKNEHSLALDLLKYKSRNGWSHKDIMRLIRWKPVGEKQNILKYYMKGEVGETASKLVLGEKLCRDMFNNGEKKEAIKSIIDYALPRELVPTELYNEKSTWEALIPNMPYTALLRNLGKISSMDLLKDFSKWEDLIIKKLSDEEAIKGARIHPINVMTAMYVYSKGKGVKGGLTWKVNQRVLAAMENAFYESFKYVEPMGVNIMIALDVSGSMDCSSGVLTAREASCGMALSLIKTEPKTVTYAFSRNFMELDINKNTSMKELLAITNRLPFEGTNCALPVQRALKKKKPIDLFVIFTDSETNQSNDGHVDTYLKKFRQEINPNAKLVVCGMTATESTIGDPQDVGTLNIAGFDSNLPKIIAEFVKGF